MGPGERGRIRKETIAFTVAFTLAYAGLALAFFHRAPRLFAELDLAFDADLGSWTIDLARAQGPHNRTRVHPLSVLLLNPAGSALKAVLREAGIDFAARLAAALLCALAGGLTVGCFRVLLTRLGVADARARLWTLLFALSATQVVFSSLPESYAFSALSLVVVFLVAAGPASARGAAIAAGVFSFGITVTNLVASILAQCFGSGRRRGGDRLRACAVPLALIVAITAALSLVQRAIFTTAQPFFLPRPLNAAYVQSLFLEPDPAAVLERLAGVASYVVFAGLAAPRLLVDERLAPRTVVDFAGVPLLTPTLASGLHWLLWMLVLAQAARGLWAGRGASAPGGSGTTRALLAWLAFCAGLHVFFGGSLFLYSGHWVFALLAVAAVGVEAHPLAGTLVTLGALLALQLAANSLLVARMLRAFS